MGEMFALLSAACFATANVSITKGSASGDADNGAFLSIVLTAVVALIAMLLVGRAPGANVLSTVGLFWFVLAGVLTAFVGRVFLFASVQSLGAMRASTVKRLNPFFAVVLGVMVLGEGLGGWMLSGMALIFTSFVVLARDAWQQSRLDTTPIMGLAFGPISAFAYALGYLARKQGLNDIADPLLGTAVGALAGIAAYALASLTRPAYRAAIVNTFTRINPWFYFTGILASFGQLFYFVALNTSPVSRVAMIASIEVFITIFLSVYIFRTRERLTVNTLVAAVLGVVGTGLILLK